MAVKGKPFIIIIQACPQCQTRVLVEYRIWMDLVEKHICWFP